MYTRALKESVVCYGQWLRRSQGNVEFYERRVESHAVGQE